MHKFSNLLKDLPALRESRMVVGGFAVWMVWKGDLPDAIQNTFQDYGGLRISEERNQSLWFFFGKDVFRGLARLQVWARMNDLPVYIQVLPTKLLLGFQLEIKRSLALCEDPRPAGRLQRRGFQFAGTAKITIRCIH